MKEYERHLKVYGTNYPLPFNTQLVSEIDEENAKIAEQFLEKYWLPEKEYLSIWKPIQDAISLKMPICPTLHSNGEFL